MSKQKLNIRNAKEAAWIIERRLANEGIETAKHPTHINPNGQHIEIVNKNTLTKYHIKYATEFFKSFGKIYFSIYNDESLMGESLDKEILDELNENDVLFFSYPGYIYYCPVWRFMEKAIQRPNNRDNSKVTLSAPITVLERFV